MLRQQLKTEKFIYTSDGKLCGMENMAYIAKNGGQFITVMPKNRKEVKRFHTRLRTDDIPWTFAFEKADTRSNGQFTKYLIYEGERSREGYRITWVYSSAKAITDKKAREELIDKTLEIVNQPTGDRDHKTTQQLWYP